MIPLLKSIVLREERSTSFSITFQPFTIYFGGKKKNLKLKLHIEKLTIKACFSPVALVPSIRRSYILTELSEQPTARQYGIGGQIATEVAARRQFIKISWNKRKQTHHSNKSSEHLKYNCIFYFRTQAHSSRSNSESQVWPCEDRLKIWQTENPLQKRKAITEIDIS